jgi:fatty acid desaturase
VIDAGMAILEAMSVTVPEARTEGTPYLPYRRVLLPIERVRELSVLRPRRVLVGAAWRWGIILAALAVVAVWTTPLAVAAAFPVVGAMFYGLFILGHDGMHRRMHPVSRTNDLWADLLVFAPIGAVVRLNKQNHLLHHRHLSTEDDPDRHKHSCLGKESRSKLVLYLTGIASIVPVINAVFVANGASRSERQWLGPYRRRDVALLAGWQVALVAGLTLAIGWWAYPVLWLGPVYVHMFLGDALRSFIEHAHPEHDDEADEHRLVTHLSNRVERLFVAPANMNFHAVHHLWPSIPYYNLPIADREIRDRPDAAGLEWTGTYAASLWRWWRALPLHDCLPRDLAR